MFKNQILEEVRSASASLVAIAQKNLELNALHLEHIRAANADYGTSDYSSEFRAKKLNSIDEKIKELLQR